MGGWRKSMTMSNTTNDNAVSAIRTLTEYADRAVTSGHRRSKFHQWVDEYALELATEDGRATASLLDRLDAGAAFVHINKCRALGVRVRLREGMGDGHRFRQGW